MGNWARDWLEDQRKAGEKCLEIKVRGDYHYVYRSTSRYDKKIKKGRKVSVYLGRLDKEYGFIPKGEKPKINMIPVPRSITDYGNSMILHNMLAELKPLLIENFPEHWEELYAMSIVRVEYQPSHIQKNDSITHGLGDFLTETRCHCTYRVCSGSITSKIL